MKDARNGWLRWGVVGLISLGTIVNYLSRNALGVLAPELKTALHFTTQQYSYVLGAFQLAYTAMLPVCGLVIDRLGLRVSFALFAGLWSLAGMASATAMGWLSLAGWRAALGLTEAAAIPAGVKTVAAWFEPHERSVAVGWFNAGTSLGALLAPPLVIAVALYGGGWRAGFLATGALGLAWAALWWLVYRDPPPRAGEVAPTAPQPSWSEILKLRRFWAIAVPRFLAEPAWQTFSFWIPLYLATERHWDLKQIALFAWAPFLAADLGGVLGGYLSPFLMRRFGVGLIDSRVVGVALGAVLMIAPGCVGLVASPFAAIGLLCVGGFAHQMISGLVNTLSADVFAEREVGTANGLVSCAGWIGGLLFSLLIGALAEGIGYAPLFAALGVFDLIGVAALIVLIRPFRASHAL